MAGTGEKKEEADYKRLHSFPLIRVRFTCSETGGAAVRQVELQGDRWSCSETGGAAVRQVELLQLDRWSCRETGGAAVRQVELQGDRWSCSETGGLHIVVVPY